ncbi:tail assembly protein, partial [Pseudomonas syringae pv. tagetis]
MAAIQYSPMTTIKLSGSLGRKFGRVHRWQIDSG